MNDLNVCLRTVLSSIDRREKERLFDLGRRMRLVYFPLYLSYLWRKWCMERLFHRKPSRCLLMEILLEMTFVNHSSPVLFVEDQLIYFVSSLIHRQSCTILDFINVFLCVRCYDIWSMVSVPPRVSYSTVRTITHKPIKRRRRLRNGVHCATFFWRWYRQWVFHWFNHSPARTRSMN